MDGEGRVGGRRGQWGQWALGATAMAGGGGGDAAACDEGEVANRGGGRARRGVVDARMLRRTVRWTVRVAFMADGGSGVRACSGSDVGWWRWRGGRCRRQWRGGETGEGTEHGRSCGALIGVDYTRALRDTVLVSKSQMNLEHRDSSGSTLVDGTNDGIVPHYGY